MLCFLEGFVMVKRIFLGLSFMAVLNFFNNGEAAPKVAGAPTTQKVAGVPKLAFVNIQKIITFDEELLPEASHEWREFHTKLKETVEPAQKELADLRDRYEKGKKEFQSLQGSSLTSQEALKRKYEEVARVEYELSTRMQELDSFTQNEVKKAQAHIGPKLDKVINEVRLAQGWDLVARGEFIVAGDERFDITADVLVKLNKEYADEKAKKATKGSAAGAPGAASDPSKKPKAV
jgi:Skp family chaperone for outer membrane proteins